MTYSAQNLLCIRCISCDQASATFSVGGYFNIYYSFDMNNWTPTNITDGTVKDLQLPRGQTIYLRAAGATGDDEPAILYPAEESDNATYAISGSLGALINDGQPGDAGTTRGELKELFNRWSGITDISGLRLGVKNVSGYEETLFNTFAECTGISSIPQDFFNGVTTLGKGCFSQMFSGCTGLTSLPANLLPFTTLAESCYSGMFENCQQLASIPEGFLPAETLAKGCYGNMFSQCSNLSEVPENLLPATTVAEDAYSYMFSQCTSLKRFPKKAWNATTLGTFACASMFNGCSSLEHIGVNFTEWAVDEFSALAHDNWVSGVAANGTFDSPLELPVKRGNSGIPNNWTINYPKDYTNCLRIMALGDDCAISLTGYQFLKYGEDPEGEWTDNTITINNGESALVKGNVAPEGIRFSATKNIKTIGGNIMSLVDEGEGKLIAIPSTDTGAFFGLFSLKQLTEIHKDLLPATTLAKNCYEGMFRGAKLTSIPGELLPANNVSDFAYRQMFAENALLNTINTKLMSATTVGEFSCEEMFSNCPTLVSIPSDLFPATNLGKACYKHAFLGTPLASIPQDLLPADEMAESCYEGMFKGTGVGYVYPELISSETLDKSCYCEMFAFSNVASIGQGALPAEQLYESCYQGMFCGCENLSALPSVLPAKAMAKDCCYLMFSECKSITEIPQGFFQATDLAEGCFSNMFSECTNLSSLPDDLLPLTVLAPHCYDCMFKGDVSLTDLPNNFLPATELAAGCYSGMFWGCSNLGVLPEDLLPAEDLVTDCYVNLFRDCTNLKEITVNFKHWEAQDLNTKKKLLKANGTLPTNMWLDGVAELGKFKSKQSSLPLEFGSGKIPLKWSPVALYSKKGTITFFGEYVGSIYG